MKSKKTLLLVGAAAVWCLAVTAAVAEGPRGEAGERSAACVRDARSLKGDDRDKAIATCLKSNGSGHSQQNRMKACNLEAGQKSLRGDERRAFMSSCLKG